MYYTKKSLHFSCVECVTLQIPGAQWCGAPSANVVRHLPLQARQDAPRASGHARNRLRGAPGCAACQRTRTESLSGRANERRVRAGTHGSARWAHQGRAGCGRARATTAAKIEEEGGKKTKERGEQREAGVEEQCLQRKPTLRQQHRTLILACHHGRRIPPYLFSLSYFSTFFTSRSFSLLNFSAFLSINTWNLASAWSKRDAFVF